MFDKLKSFYFEVSRYRKWLDDEQIARFIDGGLMDEADPAGRKTFREPEINHGSEDGKADFMIEGSKILLVDDSPDVIQLVSDFLAPYGCEVYKASTGKQAIDLLSRQATSRS